MDDGAICATCLYSASSADGSHDGGTGAAVVGYHDRCFKESDSDDNREVLCSICIEGGGDLVECLECHHAFHNSLSGQAGDLCRQNIMDNHATIYKWLTEDEGGLEAYEAIYVRQIEETCPTCLFSRTLLSHSHTATATTTCI